MIQASLNLDNVNLPLLRQQKQALVRAIRHTNAADTMHLEGILNLLNLIHDAVDAPSSANHR